MQANAPWKGAWRHEQLALKAEAPSLPELKPSFFSLLRSARYVQVAAARGDPCGLGRGPATPQAFVWCSSHVSVCFVYNRDWRKGLKGLAVGAQKTLLRESAQHSGSLPLRGMLNKRHWCERHELQDLLKFVLYPCPARQTTRPTSAGPRIQRCSIGATCAAFMRVRV